MRVWRSPAASRRRRTKDRSLFTRKRVKFIDVLYCGFPNGLFYRSLRSGDGLKPSEDSDQVEEPKMFCLVATQLVIWLM